MTRLRAAFMSLALGLAPLCATAQDAIFVRFDGSFDDATFAVESAIIDRGLVIDLRAGVGAMLNRTGPSLGAETVLFDEADVFLFCSAAVTRRVMEADPLNLVHCPYGIFVTEKDDEVRIGHRTYPDGPMQEVEALLDAIILEALGE